MMLFFRDSPRVLCCPCTIKMAIPQKIYIDVLYIDVYFVSLDGYFRMATPFRPYGVALCHKGCSYRRQRV